LLVLIAGVAGMVGCPGSPDTGDIFPDPKTAALANALKNSDLASASKLLHEGANVNSVGKEGITLPIWAMMHKNKASFEWLLDNGANPNLNPPPGEVDGGVIFWAAGADDSYWLETLLKHKADPNLKYSNQVEEEVPLWPAVMSRRRINLELLINAGADVNYENPSGSAAAGDAAAFGWFEGVYILLEAGTNCSPNTDIGKDLAYEIARRHDTASSVDRQWRDKVVQFLKDRGAGVELEAAEKRVSEAEAKDRKEHPWLYENQK
jgi:hypothetical protein